MRNGLKRAAAFALTILMLLTLLPAALATESVTTSDAVVPGLSLATVEPDYRGMFDELMAADGAAFEELAAVYMADEGFLAWVDQAVASGEMTEDEYAAFAEKINAGISTMEISGETTVGMGGTITLTSNNSRYDDNDAHTWTCSNTDVAFISANNGQSANVTGIAGGSVTITHGYATRYYWGEYGGWRYETYVITVLDSYATLTDESAEIYYLKAPNYDPDTNDTKQWCDDRLDVGTVNMTGATWKASVGVPDGDKYKNVFEPASYVRSMADLIWTEYGWRLDRSTYPGDWKAIFDAYKQELGEDITEDDIQAIYLVPYKISRNNGTTPDKHIDCTVSIVTEDFYTAIFWVIEPGTSVPIQVDAEYYKADEPVLRSNALPSEDYEDTMEVNGIIYELETGWYAEDRVTKIEEEEWPYTPSDAELEDGTVNFYAYYVPKEATVTVTKTVAGEETDESFAFEYTITNRDGTTDPVTFELTHGEKAEISVPNGAKLEVTETNAEGYTTSYEITGGVTGSGTGTAATIDPVPLAGATIAFTNTRNTVDVTIEKQVTGNMGDRSKDFEFVLSGADADGNTLKFSGSQSGGFTVDPSGSEKIQFTLKHGQYVTLSGLPLNAQLTIKEKNAGGYDMSVLYPSGEDGVRNEDIAATADGVIIPEVTITVLDGGTITVKNEKEARPDTGIVTDSLPYIVILACVVAIGAVVIVRRRGRRDE